MKNEDDFPALVPLDDTNPSSERLFRKAGEMDDRQFALLASAWAEESLDSGSLEEIESVFALMPEKRTYAEGFKKVRLKPLDDTWAGKRKLLKSAPLTGTIRRSLIISLSAAAALIFLFNIKGLLRRSDPMMPASVTEIKIAGAMPVIIDNIPAESPEKRIAVKETAVAVRQSDTGNEPVSTVAVEEKATENPIDLNIRPDIIPVGMKTVTQPVAVATTVWPVPATEEESGEKSWMIRGVNSIASLISKKEQNITGYTIASSCVKGVNAVLGWEMKLDQVKSNEGEPVAISFNSSLLSFESNTKKNNPGL